MAVHAQKSWTPSFILLGFKTWKQSLFHFHFCCKYLLSILYILNILLSHRNKREDAQSLSHVQLFVMVWTIVCQAPLSVELSRQEYWNGLSFPPPSDLPDPGIKPASFTSSALAGRFFSTEPPGKPKTELLPILNIWCVGKFWYVRKVNNNQYLSDITGTRNQMYS